jgi:hypothetical protein
VLANATTAVLLPYVGVGAGAVLARLTPRRGVDAALPSLHGVALRRAA